MKKMNKIKLISGMLLMVVFMLCALGSGDTETSDQGSGKVDSETQKSDEIGKYTLEILSCRLAKDYQKKMLSLLSINLPMSVMRTQHPLC